MTTGTVPPSRLKVYLAFAAIYIIWGSTYYGIREALNGFPPFMLGGLRFLIAAAIMFAWCLISGVKLQPGRDLWKITVTGFLLLFVGNGAVVWVEQTLPSSLVAIMIAVAPLSFTVLDKPLWRVNFRNPATLFGIACGLGGVLLLFWDRIAEQLASTSVTPEVSALFILLFGIIGWPAGSLFTKYNPVKVPNIVNSAWQMLVGAICFSCISVGRGELHGFNWGAVPANAWIALAYLIVFGSIIGFSAYVWLLQVRPATQVSTYAYVNPVVAVLLGVWLGNEQLDVKEIAGLVVILRGVLLINLAKYRGGARARSL